MKKIFITFCVLTITLIAFFDAKDRMQELDKVAANTPSQVEMKQSINKPDEQMQKSVEAPDMHKKSIELQKEINQNTNSLKENQLNNFEKKRNTIHKKTN